VARPSRRCTRLCATSSSWKWRPTDATTLGRTTDPAQFEVGLAALEERMEQVAADAAATRHLAAASNRN
jgi:hypothetical protein